MGLLFAGGMAEIAHFNGRRDLNGAPVKLIGPIQPSGDSVRWAALVTDVDPPEAINVRPENLVECGSQAASVYSSRSRATSHSTIPRRGSPAFKRQKILYEQEVAKWQARREAKWNAIRAAAEDARAYERTTELVFDDLFEVLSRLRFMDLCQTRLVCKSWHAVTRNVLRDPHWQVRMLRADEVKVVELPIKVKQEWVAFCPVRALELDVRTLVAFGAPRSQLLARLDSQWAVEKTRYASCVQINFDTEVHGYGMHAAIESAAAALSASHELADGEAIATLVPNLDLQLEIFICGYLVGIIPRRYKAAPGDCRLMRHPSYRTWPVSMQRQYPWSLRTITAELLDGTSP